MCSCALPWLMRLKLVPGPQPPGSEGVACLLRHLLGSVRPVCPEIRTGRLWASQGTEGRKASMSEIQGKTGLRPLTCLTAGLCVDFSWDIFRI